MAYKRRSKTTSDGVKRSTTHNTKTGYTKSTSTGNGTYRRTVSHSSNGKTKITETRRDGAGYVTRTQKTIGGTVKQKAPRNPTKKEKEESGAVLVLLAILFGVGYAINWFMNLFS